MIRKLKEAEAVAVFTRIYSGSPKKTLIIDDGSANGWEESDKFPKIGECEILIDDIQTPENFLAFVSALRNYYETQEGQTFFYLEEEYVESRESIEIECDATSLGEIVSFIEDGPNFDAVLVHASFRWALKFHHEHIGYFSGPKPLCDAIRNDTLIANLVSDPRWVT